MTFLSNASDFDDFKEPHPKVSAAYRNETFVYFDIETIPCQSAEYFDKLRQNVKPPATHKKPETIAAWLEENRESEAAAIMAKTSFDGGRGHVCTIAWAVNNAAPQVRHAANVQQESDVIAAFFAALDPYHAQTLVGHNIARFDLRFLRQRAVVLGITLPGRNSLPRDPKPWDKSFFDTMSAWAGGTDTVSLDNLCAYLGIPGKDGFDGSQVAEAWARGEHDRIAEYCVDDIHRARAIHQRFLIAGY